MINRLILPPKGEYPNTLEDCLVIFEGLKYESMGFPIVFLYYNYTFKCWSMSFRNPSNFSDPNIKTKTPLEAVHKMLDYLNEIK